MNTTQPAESAAMPNISVFAFDSSAVRVIQRDGEPWFVAANVCDALGLDNTSRACDRLDDDERGITTIHTPSGDQQMLIINESGLYSLIMTSRKPEAKRFKKWVTSEVLPAIRKTGRYEAPAQIERPARAPRIPGHEADRIVAASRTFNAMLRSSQAARMPLPTALRRACEVAKRETGIDMLAELRAEDHVADLEARAAGPISESTAPQSVQGFWRDWFGGQLGLPYQPCLTGQAYRAYQHWCKGGHARWLDHGDFSSHLLRHSRWHGQPLTTHQVRLKTNTGQGSTTGRLLLPGTLPFDEPIGIWARAQVDQFEKHLTAYLGQTRHEAKRLATTE